MYFNLNTRCVAPAECLQVSDSVCQCLAWTLSMLGLAMRLISNRPLFRFDIIIFLKDIKKIFYS